MKYMLLIYSDEAAMLSTGKAEMEERMAAYAAYVAAVTKAGVAGPMDRLQPTSAATTVRNVAGKTKVLNGPYAEAKEQLGGFFIIDVPDLDAAISWAARCPGASHGTVEVRPIWAM